MDTTEPGPSARCHPAPIPPPSRTIGNRNSTQTYIRNFNSNLFQSGSKSGIYVNVLTRSLCCSIKAPCHHAMTGSPQRGSTVPPMPLPHTSQTPLPLKVACNRQKEQLYVVRAMNIDGQRQRNCVIFHQNNSITYMPENNIKNTSPKNIIKSTSVTNINKNRVTLVHPSFPEVAYYVTTYISVYVGVVNNTDHTLLFDLFDKPVLARYSLALRCSVTLSLRLGRLYPLEGHCPTPLLYNDPG